MRLIGYIRVSRVNKREGESFISPTLQREAIEAYARVHGHEIVDWQQDLDQPGSKLERPGMAAALAALSKHEAEGLIAAKLDRLTRSVANLGKLLGEAKKDGWYLIAVDLGLDFSTSNGKLVANVLGSVAEWELDRRKEGWDEAQANAVERGIHIASRIPTGYTRRVVGEKEVEVSRTEDGTPTHEKRPKYDGPLLPDPSAAPIVVQLFRGRAAGTGWTALAKLLTESGIKTPYGNATWTPAAAAKLVHNRVYLGEARSGRHRNASAHDPLVTRAEWEAAQLDRSISSTSSADALLLSGLVRCGGCRYLAKPDHMKGRDGSRLGLYRCRRIHAEGTCGAPATVMSRLLEPWVEAEFLAAVGRDGPIAFGSAPSDGLAEAERFLEEAEQELAAFIDATSALDVGVVAMRVGIESRARRADNARKVLAEEQRAAGDAVGSIHRAEMLEAWPELTTDEKRLLISTVIDAIVIWPTRGSGKQVPVSERAEIFWRGQAPADLPRRGRRVPLKAWPRNVLAELRTGDRPGDLLQSKRHD